MTKARDTANLTGSGVTLPLLDIDAGTDIGAALVDADLMIVDDGAGGTNRKATMSRLATYMGTKIGGGLEFIASTDASSSANVSFTGFDSSKYDSYVFTLGNVLPATDIVLLEVVLSVDGGLNYLTASDSYTVTDSTGQGAGDAPRLRLYYTGQGNAALDAGISANVNLNFPHINAPTYLFTNGLSTIASGALEINYGYGPGKTKAATVVNAIKFSYSSGNIASGTITMYGMVNS